MEDKVRNNEYGEILIYQTDDGDTNKDVGKVSAEIAKLHAETEFEKV